MNERARLELSIVQVVSIAAGVVALAFGAGAAWGESRCMPEIQRIASELRLELNAIRHDLEAHERIPIHPGAASSQVLEQLSDRLRRLETTENTRKR